METWRQLLGAVVERRHGRRVFAGVPWLFVLLLTGAVGSGLPRAFAQDAQETQETQEVGVPDLVAKLPGESIEAGRHVLGEILKLGPEAVSEVAGMVAAPGAGDDSKARFALYGLANYVTRPGAKAERVLFSRAVLGRLEPATDPQVKSFLISLLQVAGKGEAVEPLSKLLRDPALCEPATQALLAIRTKDVAPALLSALTNAEGTCRVTLIRALGDLRARAAVTAILPFATDKDATLRRTAQWALAEIGDPAAADVLAGAAQVDAVFDRAHSTSLYLSFARRLAQEGRKKECARICRDLLATRTAPADRHLYLDALAILVGVEGKGALDEVVAALGNGDKQVREASLALAACLSGEPVTRRLVAVMAEASPEARAEVVGALGRRKDRAAEPAVLAALKDEEKAVRLAAIDAAARLGSKKAVEGLLGSLSTEEADEVSAAKAALLRLPGDRILAPAAAALPGVSTPGRVALLQILGARRAKPQFPAVLAATKDETPDVRVAAIRTLGQLADPDALPQLLELLFAAPEGAEQDEAQQAVVRVCERIPDPAACAEPLLAALQSAAGPSRARLFGALAAIGGDKAVAAVAAETQAADAAVQDAAVRALADWRDVGAAPELLKLAKDAGSTRHRVVATRGYVRLAGLPASGPVEQRARMFRDALQLAPRPDEKRLALGSLSELRHIEALKVAAALLDDENLADDAAAAVVRIALPEKGKEKEQPLQGPEVVAALAKVVAVTQDPKVKEQAAAYLESIPRPDSANIAQGRPVKTSGAHEGDHVPEKAVDGNSADPNAGWFGHQTPCSLTVDLGKPTRIDSVHVFFYWDGSRHYQYTLETSLDEKEWRAAVDRSKNDRPATSRGVVHSFDPVEARYVRINVLKNSANQAAHLVELKVYAAGTAPVAAVAPKPDAEGFIPLFNGKDLTGWAGSTKGYIAENGILVCLKEGGGTLRTEEQYADFIFRFEFRLPPGANNGLGIRFTGGNPAYEGMELQILDDTAEQYKNLAPYQYHGSIYGVVPAKRGHQKPVGEWNSQEVIAKGRHITVILNGATIIDADLDKVMAEGGPADKKPHPGLLNAKGYIGFLGHGARVEFRNIRIKEL